MHIKWAGNTKPAAGVRACKSMNDLRRVAVLITNSMVGHPLESFLYSSFAAEYHVYNMCVLLYCRQAAVY